MPMTQRQPRREGSRQTLAARPPQAAGRRHHPHMWVVGPASAADFTALEEAYRLRAAVFADELAWVPARNGYERDRCDTAALHFAVFAPGAGLVGYARVLLPEHGFMLAREFSALLAGEALRLDSRRAFEVSRFVVHPRYRGLRDAAGRSAADHLARRVARWAIAARRSDWYGVCEQRHIRALRLRGLPFVAFGRIVEYQPGVRACAARLCLPEAAEALRRRRERDYAWYLGGMDLPW
jgi:N-acyl-L-homoserine lactone synthetase